MSGNRPAGRRRYDSSGRREQAAATRRRIVAAAHELFTARGYAGTTIADVAAAASVSTPTVYAGFGSKVGLLKVCIDMAIAGDDRDLTVAQRPTAQWVFAAKDGRELLSRYAFMMGGIAEAAGPIYTVLVRAADTDPELDALLTDLEGQRLVAAERVAIAVRDRGGLPAGVTLDDARDAVWVAAAPETYELLRRSRGWSTERYVSWARAVLHATVLGKAPGPPPASRPA